MTIDDIKKSICKWITNDGEYAVQIPDNAASRHGKYYAVGVIHVSQYGSLTQPPPKAPNEDHYRVAQYVATVTVHEVAGDGEKLRKFRNDFISTEFCDFVKARFNVADGLDRSFSVWDMNDIADETINDGDFFIEQYVLSFRVQFNDFVGYNRGPIESVSGKIGTEDFEVARS